MPTFPKHSHTVDPLLASKHYQDPVTNMPACEYYVPKFKTHGLMDFAPRWAYSPGFYGMIRYHPRLWGTTYSVGGRWWPVEGGVGQWLVAGGQRGGG